ncbi:MAG TPA: FecR domain-containing protein [Chryseolinea sp.]|nr:FecR domain-containing protein [Chryseolinea sp.]
MNKRELAQLIQNFREGKATEQEKRRLEAYWDNALKDTTPLDNLPPEEQEILKSEMFNSIKTRLHLKGSTRVSFYRPLYRVAAAILLLVAVSSVLYFNLPIVGEHAQLDTSSAVIETKYGERRTIVLPDESTVVLNGNSKLKYSKNWSGQIREVWIDGEGFFAVQHTKSHQKFVVHTREGLSVEVLGTKFNVKSREHGSEVLLTEGKVKLNVDNTESPVYLNPGELATVKENQLSKRVVEGIQYTSWVRSKLVFDKTPLNELAQILQDTYGLKVSFQNEGLEQRQLSGEISSASADDILFAIAETFNIKVTKMDDKTVILSSK